MTLEFWIWSHASCALVVASMAGMVLKRTSSLFARATVLAGSFILSLMPVYATDFSGFTLAHIGILSTSTLVLLAAEFFIRLKFPPHLHRNQNLFVIFAGVALYPSAAGFFEWDLYFFGYQTAMSWTVLGIAIVALVFRHQLLALCLTSAVVMHQLMIHESTNLWDYLIDPWLFLAALTQFTWSTLTIRTKRRTQQSDIHAA
jgi:hypothetical protein